ncbi:MAG: DNA double-strand break repair protein Mre11, partial [Halobacteriota archaeon]
MSRVIHTGDTHIGYRQYHSPVRRQDYLDAFRQVVEDAVADGVDAVVHAGDLFDDRRPDLPDLLETISILRELDRADIPFLAIVGNHEDARRGQWLDLFETLDLAIHLDDDGTVVDDTTFYGLDYVPESRRDRLEYDFTPPETAHAALVGHGLFTPFPHGDWDLETVLESATVDFDAVLLGDDHTPETKNLDGVWATYCGSTERTSASERENRGYNLVTFDEGVNITRRGLDTREFVFLDLTLAESEGAALVRERIREADVEDAVVVVTIEGDGGDVTPAAIEQFGQERGALVTRVNDRREFDDEADIEVSFADPDDAVRERVREMGLSDAARTIDDTVRDADVADANVRDRVKSRVESLLDEPDAFEPAAAEQSPADHEEDSSEDGHDAPVEAAGNGDVDAARGDRSEANDRSVDEDSAVAADSSESTGESGQTDGESANEEPVEDGPADEEP